jgi:hypothetical protein
MPALFQRRANQTIRRGLLLVLFVIVGCPTALMLYVRTPYVTGENYVRDQPVEFDHRHHTRDDGIECRYCHHEVERSRWAGMPSTSLCMGCHSQIWNDSAQIEPLRRSYYSGTPLRWNRVHHLPDFVYFDHSIHVAKGVGCVTCHGRVDQMPEVRQVRSLQMRWCLDCHRDPAPHLRPPDEVTNMEWAAPGDPRRVGARIAEELGVESLTYCTACHR